jgi:methylenetetrahydrofolate dehydrogenase (NADP+)/methenyltetrahydrofolate cyclohydrolase
VIDVGINRITDAAVSAAIFGDAPARSVIGDAHPVQIPEVAGFYTPVPGGVGPLTIAMLMANSVAAAEVHTRP